jgi:hypothetical protein
MKTNISIPIWGINLIACLLNAGICAFRVASNLWTPFYWANFACIFVSGGIVIWYCGFITKQLKVNKP